VLKYVKSLVLVVRFRLVDFSYMSCQVCRLLCIAHCCMFSCFCCWYSVSF